MGWTFFCIGRRIAFLDGTVRRIDDEGASRIGGHILPGVDFLRSMDRA